MGNFLPLNALVGDGTVLKGNHPPINYDSLVNPQFPHSKACHEVIFAGLDGVVIRDSYLKIDGAAGPSGIEAAGWRRMCTSFQSVSNDLCGSLASVARRIASTCSYVHPLSLPHLGIPSCYP